MSKFAGKEKKVRRQSVSIKQKVTLEKFRDMNIDSIPAIEAANKTIMGIAERDGYVPFEEFYKAVEIYERITKFAQFHFPGAKEGAAIAEGIYNILDDLDCTSENTLFCQSLCPDEINHEKGDISDLLKTHYKGKVFHMGGLAGVPFTGKTGFGAYAHHVPEDGNLFIIFAPHIGISPELKLGEFSREGQSHAGAACGAAVGALNYCRTCKTTGAKPEADFADYQMSFLKAEIMKRADNIIGCGSANEEQRELVYEVYEICQDFMDRIVHTHFGKKGKLILLGGIQINMPRPLCDFFQPILFECREQGKETIDLFEDAFGPRPAEEDLVDEGDFA